MLSGGSLRQSIGGLDSSGGAPSLDRRRLQEILATVELFESWGVAVFPGPFGEKGAHVKEWPSLSAQEACRRAKAAAANELGASTWPPGPGPRPAGIVSP